MKTRRKIPVTGISGCGDLFFRGGFMVYSPGQKSFSVNAVLQPKPRLVWYNGYSIETIAAHLEIWFAEELQSHQRQYHHP